MKEYKIAIKKTASPKLAERMNEAFGLYCETTTTYIKDLEGDREQITVTVKPYVKSGLTVKLQNQVIGFLRGYRGGHADGLTEREKNEETNLEIEEMGSSESVKTKLAVPKKPRGEKAKKNNMDFLFPENQQIKTRRRKGK